MIKAFIHIILAFSVFFSSGGFWVNNHYCQNELTRTSFFVSFGSCCAGDTSSPCSKEKMSCANEGQKEEDGCCHNEPSFHKLNQNLKVEEAKFKSIEQLIVLHPTLSDISIQLPSFNKQALQFLSYTPPLIVYDRQVRLQTFLC